MKILSTFLLLASPALAVAPTSLANKVYRDTWGGLSEFFQTTIIFGVDGRFTELDRTGLLLPPYQSQLNWFSTGTYVYHRTSDTVASVDLNYDGNQPLPSPRQLNYTTDLGGEYDHAAYDRTSTFTLTDAIGPLSAVSNISLRGTVSPGHPLIAGMIIPGTPRPSPVATYAPPPDTVQREVLIRVVGPSLSQFGVNGVWANPTFQVYQGTTPARVDGRLMTDASMRAAYRLLFNFVGAFGLVLGANDAVMMTRLDPGAYTVVAATAANDPGGEALIEVYLLP